MNIQMNEFHGISICDTFMYKYTTHFKLLFNLTFKNVKD
jgi:hypothetical protein